MEGHKGYMRRHQFRGGEVNDPSVKGEMSQVADTRNVLVSYVLPSSHQSLQSRHRYSITHTFIIHIILGRRCSKKVKLLPCPIKILLRKQMWAWRHSSTHS
jgi:hypothetical protein